MATDTITAVTLRDDLVEWAVMPRGRGGAGAAAAGRVELAADSPAEANGGGPVAVATPPEERVREACARVHGPATIGIPTHQLLVRVMDFPAAEPDEIAGMVELQVDKFSPFPVDSMVVSYEELKRTEDTVRVLVAAARERVVERIGDTLSAAGIRPKRVDAAALGRWRVLRDAGELNDEERQVAVLLDGPYCDLMVFQEQMPLVVRSLGDVSALSPDEFREELVEDVRATLMGLELEHGVAGHCSVTVWQREDALPTGLTEALEEACRCRVACRSLEELPLATEGLVRRTAERDGTIDLTPEAWRLSTQRRRFQRRMGWAAAGIFGLWLLAGGLFLGWITYQNSRLSNLRAEAARWQAPAKRVRDLRRRVAVIKQYTDRRISTLECLREICLQLPPAGVELASYSYRKDDGVKLTGEGQTVALVYEFKKSLDQSELFGEVVLQGPRYDVRRHVQVFDMDIGWK